MNILLTNDDGIYAEGIRILAEVLIKSGHNVTIAAPDRERSAAGHSITIREPLRVKKIDMKIDGVNSYMITGTPADCVKIGLEKIVIQKPDIVISGINNGPNLGFDVLYSGTVSAAMEAYMMGYNSLAVSLKYNGNNNYFTASKIIEKYISENDFSLLSDKVLLNINIPDLPEEKIKGIKYTSLGTSLYEDTFEKRIDPMGNPYYWLTDGGGRKEKAENSDIRVIKENNITITPLQLKLTNNKLKEELKERF